jgi:hypothetical protein
MQTLTIKDDLLEPFYIQASENQYTVIKVSTGKNDKPVENDYGYYTQFNTALERIARLQLIERGGTLTLDAFVKAFTGKLDAFTAKFKAFKA